MSVKSKSRKPVSRTIQGAPSWRIASNTVEAWVTQRGGHLAPVTFRTANGDIQPFAIAPWAEESLDEDTPDLLKTLRGDFFCAPFGGNGTPWRGEAHPPHGETASNPWSSPTISQPQSDRHVFTAEMQTSVRSGRATKRIELRDDETNLYLRHNLEGMTGPMSLGHHAILQCPPKEGAGRISLSPYHRGQVCPLPFEDPTIGGYSALKMGAKFTKLDTVERADGEFCDVSRYPAREGFEDLVMVRTKPRPEPVWSTVSFPEQGYLWFSLRDVKVLNSTVLWMSNGGRHYAPWSGRHRCVLGVEDVTSYFHFGLAESAGSNPHAERGAATTLKLSRRRPTEVSYIMGVVPIPPDFDQVKKIRFTTEGMILRAWSDAKVFHPVDWNYLKIGG